MWNPAPPVTRPPRRDNHCRIAAEVEGGRDLTFSSRPFPERMAKLAICGSASGRASKMTSSTPMGAVTLSRIRPGNWVDYKGSVNGDDACSRK